LSFIVSLDCTFILTSLTIENVCGLMNGPDELVLEKVDLEPWTFTLVFDLLIENFNLDYIF
jgi:hypothetical protein